MAEETPVAPPAEEQPTVTVTLTVAMSEGSTGVTGQPGDQVELPVEQAEAWVAAGVATLDAPARSARSNPASGGSQPEPPSVPRGASRRATA